MALKDEIESIGKFVKEKSDCLAHNHILTNIWEGSLLQYILDDLSKQLSPKSYAAIEPRVSPINLAPQVIDKLSKIYTPGPKRTIVEGTGNENDQKLLSWYEDEMQMNQQMNIVNELFNLHKSVAYEPYLEDSKPKLRPVPSDRAIAYSNDILNPLKRTAWVKKIGEQKIGNKTTMVYFVYTDNEFWIVDEDFEPIPEFMARVNNREGINPVRKIPSAYVNRSQFSIIPIKDTDFLRMVKLLPVLLSDLNFAVMMQAFSIVYGIDVDDENIVMSPNAFWNFQSDPAKKTTPQIGTIKPQVDIQQVIELVIAEMSMWLKSKNVRPGAIGNIGAESAASGVSKVVDNADTSEDRTRQAQFFKESEERDFWPLITGHMHPFWQKNKMIDQTMSFSKGVKISVEFPEQLPTVDRTQILDDVIKELDKELTLPEIAIQRINPDMSEQEAKDLYDEIKARKTEARTPQLIETEDDENSDEEQQSLTGDTTTENQGDTLSGQERTAKGSDTAAE